MEFLFYLFKVKTIYLIGFFILQTMIYESLTQSDCVPIVNHPDRVRCSGPSLKNIPTNASALIVSGTSSQRISLRKIQRSDFKDLNLFEIFISFTELTEIDEDSFQDLKQLKRVVLKYNKIMTIHQGTFHGLNSLEMIDLSGNEYCTIDTGTFSQLNSLMDLYLGNMKLRSLEKSTFQGLKSLVVLDLHGNSLQHIQNDVISSFPKLESLDITSNILKTLPEDLKSTLSVLKHLSLSDNPWQCNCDLEWMKELTNLTVNTKRIGLADMIVCYGPKQLRYRSLIDVPKSKITCIPPKIIGCGGPYEVMEGSILRMHCEVEGDPFPDFSWQTPSGLRINSTEHTTGYSTIDNGTVLVLAADITSNGQWSVLVANTGGKDSSTVKVNVVLSTTTKATETTKTAEATVTTETTEIIVDEESPSPKGKKADNSMIMIAGGAGGGAFLIGVSTVAYCLHRKNKNKVKPSKKRHDVENGQKKGKGIRVNKVSQKL